MQLLRFASRVMRRRERLWLHCSYEQLGSLGTTAQLYKLIERKVGDVIPDIGIEQKVVSFMQAIRCFQTEV